jgi:pyridoxal phosphate enzyme (YggS family)
LIESAADRLGRILERIDAAARRSGRNPKDITLVAVTKTISLEKVLPYIQAGVHHIGENRVQEALIKYSTPSTFLGEGPGEGPSRPSFHLIGQLQSNKAKKAVEFFDMVQSLDRLALADDLNRHAAEMKKVLPCLVEVKISSEETKSGLDPERLEELLNQLKTRTSLAIKGLMGIAPFAAGGESARPYFAKLRRLFEKTQLEILSMGMSSDFEAAIQEGSTMVRIGTALFGPRA